MRNIRGLLAYEGTSFLGWQKTQAGQSIQGELEKALSIALRRTTTVEAASRTDAGVHARGQVVNFFIDKDDDLQKLRQSLNALLPREIVAVRLEESSPDFHPTLDAIKKEYHYEIVFGSVQSPFLRMHSWHVPNTLDIEKMRAAASQLIGEHDFSAFCNDRSLLEIDPICHLLDLIIEEISPGHLRIRTIGNRFLYKMVRNLVGTLVYVGCGKLEALNMKELLQSKQRSLAGITAPAQGLFLHQVFYDLA